MTSDVIDGLEAGPQIRHVATQPAPSSDEKDLK
jgi:hypothetical protein